MLYSKQVGNCEMPIMRIKESEEMSTPNIYYAIRFRQKGKKSILLPLVNTSQSDSEYALLVQLIEGGLLDDSMEAIPTLSSWDELVDFMNELGEESAEEWLIDREDFAGLPDMEEIAAYHLYGLQEDQGEYELGELYVDREKQKCKCFLYTSEESGAEKTVEEIERLFDED